MPYGADAGREGNEQKARKQGEHDRRDSGADRPAPAGPGRIDYVLRVAQYEPESLLDMVSVAGPMPMHITYPAPLMARKVRASIAKDLRDLQLNLTSST